MSEHVLEISDGQFASEVLQADLPVVVDFGRLGVVPAG